MPGRSLLLLMVMLLGVGCDDAEPVATNLAALSAFQQDFNGRHVIVSGTLRTFDNPRHYWIENEALNRVALDVANLEGNLDLASLTGLELVVQGTFRYDPAAGRRVEVLEVQTAPER